MGVSLFQVGRGTVGKINMVGAIEANRRRVVFDGLRRVACLQSRVSLCLELWGDNIMYVLALVDRTSPASKRTN